MRELYEADSTNPVSMEPGEYGLTRGTCFCARRLDVVAVAGLLRLSWCVFGWGGFFRAFHEFAFLHSFVNPEQPASNRWRGSDSQPISPNHHTSNSSSNSDSLNRSYLSHTRHDTHSRLQRRGLRSLWRLVSNSSATHLVRRLFVFINNGTNWTDLIPDS